jgi:dipeptidyl aminopeptidase/acylaminoacyl peptidase
MKSFFFLVCLALNYSAFCQSSLKSKPPIDTSVFRKWPHLGDPVISNNGQYVVFSVRNQPLGSTSLVLKKTSGAMLKEIIIEKNAPSDYFFSKDNKQLVWLNADTLFRLNLATDKMVFTCGIRLLKVPYQKDADWIAFQLKNSVKEMVLHNLVTDKEIRFTGVLNFQFSNLGKVLVVKRENKEGDSLINCLDWVDLNIGAITTIWASREFPGKRLTLESFSLDFLGEQVAFIVQNKENSQSSNSVWYYKNGQEKAMKIVEEKLEGLAENLTISSFLPKFSRNGKWLFFQLQETLGNRKSKASSVKVDIWSYKDIVLQPEQMRRAELGQKVYAAVVPSGGGKAIRLEMESEDVQTGPLLITGDFVVLKDAVDVSYWWPHSPQPAAYLVSLKDGTRKLLSINGSNLYGYSFSPSGQYLIFWDTQLAAFFNYDIRSGKKINLSKSIPVSLVAEIQRSTERLPTSLEPIGWLNGDEAILIYDNYDIWKVDPKGLTPAVNITNGYGVKHRVKLRLLDEEANSIEKKLVYNQKDTLWLTGFNTLNKHNGFFRKKLNENGDPEQLTMGPYTYFRTTSQKGGFFHSFGSGMQPVKAANLNGWIVKRSSCTQAPNYYFTSDLKSFTPLTNLHPQKDYNWITSELITWKMFDGNLSQGVLYKPENFDSQKKYPVIFNYYEKLSHRLYEFPSPAFTNSNINIPWFVSNGYLVFIPDIHYKIASKSGKPIGEWAYNSVVSAAQYLAKLPYVNKNRMAIQGHSFGGLETAYLATHTGLFAAAAEAAGSTDPISRYLTLVPLMAPYEHTGNQESRETGHELYGATPWERPELYSKNSAVLNAHKATTPLLIIHNMKDNQVQWRQGVELYMAMRRLGKKCWMLQYDDGGHDVGGKSAVDYTIRLTQFFDHYLKDALPPKWMTEGVPASQKGLEYGYELDASGKKP